MNYSTVPEARSPWSRCWFHLSTVAGGAILVFLLAMRRRWVESMGRTVNTCHDMGSKPPQLKGRKKGREANRLWERRRKGGNFGSAINAMNDAIKNKGGLALAFTISSLDGIGGCKSGALCLETACPSGSVHLASWGSYTLTSL